MKKSILLKLHFKRAIKIYPVILFVTLLTLVSIVTVAFLAIANHSNGENKQKINIAIVGDAESSYVSIGMEVLQNMDNSRFFMNFIQMQEEEAIQALKNDKIAGYVYIPEDFVESVYYGRNVKARYVIKDGPVKISPMVSAEVINVVSKFVVETQNGNYSLSELAENIGKGRKIRKDLENMTFKYVEFIVNRNESFTMNIVGISDLITLPGYYICGLMIFFLLIWGISCNRLLSGRNVTFSRILCCKGIKVRYQLLCEYLAFLCITFMTLVIFAAGIGAVVANKSFGITELETANIVTCIGFVFKMLPVIIMVTAMHIMLYELFGSNVSGLLVQFIIAVGLGYVSGCFYPNYFFPDAVRQLADILPSGAGFMYARKLMAGTLSLKDFALPILYTFAFFVLAISVRKRNMEVGKE